MKKPTKLAYYRRYVNGYTINELCEITGIPLGTMRRYDSGDLDLNNASVSNVKKLAKALHCTIDDLTDDVEINDSKV